jgi:hypothetical protein
MNENRIMKPIKIVKKKFLPYSLSPSPLPSLSLSLSLSLS